jgi:hypothetical protein
MIYKYTKSDLNRNHEMSVNEQMNKYKKDRFELFLDSITSTLTILRFLCVIAYIFIYILYMFAYILYEVHRWLYGQWLYI